jgi:hypothetical protein
MFCPNCRCEFPEWIGKCPCCDIPLIGKLPPKPQAPGKSVSHEALVDLVRENGGKLKIDLITTDVGKEKKWQFPYMGYGFAWAKRMQGKFRNVRVDLKITEVARVRKWQFPYMGYGYAWAKTMQGYIGAHEISLVARKVGMERKWGFPYMAYGYAWLEEMSGECGHKLSIDLLTTDVGREKKWEFPYMGYGYAWADKAILTLRLNE